MIELRFVERKVPCTWENYNAMGYVTEKVLQYRFRGYVPQPTTTDIFTTSVAEDFMWSDWQDVPTVKSP